MDETKKESKFRLTGSYISGPESKRCKEIHTSENFVAPKCLAPFVCFKWKRLYWSVTSYIEKKCH